MSRVRAIDRALDVLAALAGGPLGVTDVAERARVPKSTAARMLATLLASDAVEQLPADSRYRLGPRILAMGGAIRAQADLVTVAHPHLVELAADVGEAAGLSVAEGFLVRYIDQVSTDHEVQVRDWTGTTAPMHTVSSGQVLLAQLSPAALARVLPDHLERLTPHTITEKAALRRRLHQVRRDGYAWVRDEFAEGITSVAVAITDQAGEVVAAVHVHGPSYRFPAPGDEAAIGSRVGLTASRIAVRS
jgi:DNA-binding IclR family transcriptional regulator